MGALGHYLEGDGIATTQISLIRAHTQTIRPPRALWVSFDLGRPLGVPGDPGFQSRVLLHALRLLEAPAGPVLEEFPEDAPGGGAGATPVVCPVSFPTAGHGAGGPHQLASAFRQEVARMRGWYDAALEQRGRTTAGTTGMEPEAVAEFLVGFLQGDRPASPVAGASLGMAVKMATEDLKAFYLEGVTAQPGQPSDSRSLADWFWGSTAAARIINAIREACLEGRDPETQLLGKLLLVPRSQLSRFQA